MKILIEVEGSVVKLRLNYPHWMLLWAGQPR